MLEVSVSDFGLVVDWKDCRSFNLMLLSEDLPTSPFASYLSQMLKTLQTFGKYK
jgi:hypothetical protein